MIPARWPLPRHLSSAFFRAPHVMPGAAAGAAASSKPRTTSGPSPMRPGRRRPLTLGGARNQSGAAAPALGALAAAASSTGDAERREQGRRSGNERWQQALKILLVDASTNHLPRLGLNFQSMRLRPIQMRVSLYAAQVGYQHGIRPEFRSSSSNLILMSYNDPILDAYIHQVWLCRACQCGYVLEG